MCFDIPELDGPVVARGGKPASIWTKRDICHTISVLLLYLRLCKRIQLLPRICIPQPGGSIITCRSEIGSIRAEDHAVDGACVPDRGVPDSDAAVPARTCQALMIRAEGNTIHRI